MIVLITMAFGASQVVAYVGVWQRQRDWGWALGMLVTVVGLTVSLALFEAGEEWSWLAGLMAVGYGVTLVALIFWAAKARQTGSRAP